MDATFPETYPPEQWDNIGEYRRPFLDAARGMRRLFIVGRKAPDQFFIYGIFDDYELACSYCEDEFDFVLTQFAMNVPNYALSMDWKPGSMFLCGRVKQPAIPAEWWENP